MHGCVDAWVEFAFFIFYFNLRAEKQSLEAKKAGLGAKQNLVWG